MTPCRPVSLSPSPAQRLVCAILAGRANGGALARLAEDDWARVVEAASREGVAPLLAWALYERGWPGAVPADVRSELEAIWRTSAVRTVRTSQALLGVLEALAQPPAVPVVLLKGAALGPTVYPAPDLRPMSDLDLLVTRDRIDDAVGRLTARGFDRLGPEMRHGMTRATHRHVTLQARNSRHFMVELHWTLACSEGQRHEPDMGWFWDQTELFDPRLLGLPGASRLLDGDAAASAAPCLVLTPTAQLLYLAAHVILYHTAAQRPLIWFYDFHLLAEHHAEAIDWGELLRRAREFHWAGAVAEALGSARQLYGTSLPDGVRHELDASRGGQSPALLRRRSRPAQTRAMRTIARAATLKPRALIRYVWGIVVPGPAYMRWRYRPRPAWLWPLWYPYRWADIARDALRTLWRILRARAPA